MSTSSVVDSQAFRFMSYLSSGVEPRTGLYRLAISPPALPSGDLAGPDFAVELGFSPMNPLNSGFGIGWALNLTTYSPPSKTLSLHTGDVFKQTSTTPDGKPVFGENKLHTFNFTENGDGTYRVAHKSGRIELLQTYGSGADQLALPYQIYNLSGRMIRLNHKNFDGVYRLESIEDADDTLLLIERNPAGTVVDFLMRPYGGADGSALARYSLKINQGQLQEIVLPSVDRASWRVTYETIRGILCVKQVDSPTGGREVLEYTDEGHIVPGTPAQLNLPRVTRLYTYPGFEQPMIEMAYLYHSTDDNKGHNFLGHPAAVSRVDGMDPTYDVSHTFDYGNTTQLIDEVVINGKVERQVVREVITTFNRFHSQIEQKTLQDHCVKCEVTQFFADDRPFAEQVPQFQSPKETRIIWQKDNDSNAYRDEVTLTTFDGKGNLTEETHHSKVRTAYRYYPATASRGCPADPDGFERNLAQVDVHPAPTSTGGPKAPILRTVTTYQDLKALSRSASNGWLMPVTEVLTQVENSTKTELQRTKNEYHEASVDVFMHGRPIRQTQIMGGEKTVSEFEYSKPVSVLAGEAVLQTVETLTGFDHMLAGDPDPRHVQKINTSQDSLNHGGPLLTFDENGVTILYKYDELGRIIEETVAPEATDIKATRLYTYTLTSISGGQAEQTVTDVKGVTTRSLFDGLFRLIYQERQDIDNIPLNGAYRQTYEAVYDAQGNKVEESEFDWPDGEATAPSPDYDWPDNQSLLKLTTRYQFNAWGEQYCTITPDGILHFDETDHVGQTQWKEGPVQRSWRQSAGDMPLTSGYTLTFMNAFNQPTRIERFNAPDDPTPLSVDEFEFDGLGRKSKETDAQDHSTEYAYDAFNRLTLTQLPDGALVRRDYSAHSEEDWPREIRVNDIVLGVRRYDGIGRMVSLATGGREQSFTYEDGLMQPASVTTSLGEIRYLYQPQLGEDPWRRFLPGDTGEVTAEYEFDNQNARLTLCKEDDLTLTRAYYSNGEIKQEIRHQGTNEDTMSYGTSYLGRQLSYTDVLNQVQRFGYDLAGRMVYTALGTTQSRFSYDELGRTAQIDTSDGAQRVTITLEYDKFDRETRRTFDLGAVIQEMTQDYSEVDALVKRTLKEGPTLVREEVYGYDPRHRLTTYQCTGSQPPIDPYGNEILSQTFGFDAINNLTRVHTESPRGINVATYYFENPDKTQLSRVTNNKPEFNYPAEIKLHYDANGNLTTDERGRNLKYDPLNRLLSVSALPGETRSTYSYDPLNILAGSGETGSESRRFYRDGELANQIHEDHNSTFIKANGTVLAERQEGAVPKSSCLAPMTKTVFCLRSVRAFFRKLITQLTDIMRKVRR